MKLMKVLDKMMKIEEVSAHCDVPCGIYDPITAQIAALTVVRMMDQIAENESAEQTTASKNKMARLVATKEEHAEKVKHEIRVIWGDFIKDEHLEKYPNLHELTHQIMKLGGKSKQGVNREDAVALLEKVNEFAKIFWEIKGVETFTSNAPYAPNLPVVYHK